MTNEIKEILEYMSKVAFHEVGMQLETEQVKTLLDYITNLQKTQETLIKNDNEIITNLQEENENLKDFNKKLQATKDRLGRLECEINEEIERLNKRLEEDKGKPYIDNTKIVMLGTLEIILDRIKN